MMIEVFIDDSAAFKIFANPYNLLIAIGREREDGGGYGVIIFLSAGDVLEALIIVDKLLTESQEKAALVAGDILRGIQQESMKILRSRGRKVSQSKVLTPDLIDRIVEELKCRGRVETGKMLANVG